MQKRLKTLCAKTFSKTVALKLFKDNYTNNGKYITKKNTRSNILIITL